MVYMCSLMPCKNLKVKCQVYKQDTEIEILSFVNKARVLLFFFFFFFTYVLYWYKLQSDVAFFC